MACTNLIKPLSAKATHNKTNRVWLFDLDNTLHDASHAVFAQIDVSMTKAIMKALDIGFVQATALRQKYWERYGATMIGMERHHGVNASTFLHMSHDFHAPDFVKPERNLAALLQNAPGIKYILTNAPHDYACSVLDALGIRHCFAGICSIDQMRLQGTYRPKPSPALMHQLLGQLQCKPTETILVEDTLKNLKIAKQLHLKTVHIFNAGTPFSSKHKIRPSYVDLRVKSVHELLRHPFSHS